MSNQKKAELVNDNFGIQSFWGGHGEILLRARFMPKGTVCPEIPDSAIRPSSDSRNSQIANRLEPENRPSES
jgi:hypothetical protein